MFLPGHDRPGPVPTRQLSIAVLISLDDSSLRSQFELVCGAESYSAYCRPLHL
ncbi:hypothetical protein EXIGLDRAFT_720019 [Exidia glandulosa HHB12029]|uniref:Uncharacterized protein n=1 Tax=Exidia glandulosa HHB12029 TaxID=1314781 RepID=A0A165NM73_EXIGL|nr:hypothetical protein EXIGLDRAFT_720019 [Exidia glandulosa HHB12029]